MATSTKKDAGEAEVQKKADEATEQGFIGVKTDPLPNSAYSLESGPESPSAWELHQTALKQRADALKGSAGKEA